MKSREAAMREYPILVAHSDYGDTDCCGILMPVPRGDREDLTCNECGAVVDIVEAGQAEGTLLRMALSAGVCSEACPRCAGVNIFPGFTSMEAYTCRHCGQGVVVQRPAQ